jgi:GntR family transcriptional regulator
MNIHSPLTLSQTDGRPMYLQIIDQVRHKVAIGDWPPGAEMPSIRQLAADLRVSVITVRRAYQELEQEGVILTQAGRGSFVAQAPTPSKAEWEDQLRQALDQAVRLGALLGLDTTELGARLRQAIDHQEKQ